MESTHSDESNDEPNAKRPKMETEGSTTSSQPEAVEPFSRCRQRKKRTRPASFDRHSTVWSRAVRSFGGSSVASVWSPTMVMSQILPALYVGSERDSNDVDQLRANRISHIVRIHSSIESLLVRDPAIKYRYLKINDHPHALLYLHFSDIIDFVHAARLAGGTVLIHCMAGVSRSVTLATAYLMSTTDVDLRDAQDHIRLSRRRAWPNEGFQQQLETFEILEQGLDKERGRLRSTSNPLYAGDCFYVRRRLATTGWRVEVAEQLLLATRDPHQVEAETEEEELEDTTKVTHVVRIGTKCRELVPMKPSIVYHFIELTSESPADCNLREHLPAVDEFIHNARLQKDSRVLINWTSGKVARGASLVLGYLLSVQTRFDLDDLLKHVMQVCDENIKSTEQLIVQLRTFRNEDLIAERNRLAGLFSLKEDEVECLKKDREFIAKSLRESDK